MNRDGVLMEPPRCAKCGEQCYHDRLYTGGIGWRSYWICPNHHQEDGHLVKVA